MLTSKWTNWLAFPTVMLFAGAVNCMADDGPSAPNRVAWAYQVAHAGGGEYWIGIMGAPVDPLLQKHLKIDAGVVIQHVLPNSPADQAGIEEDDILLKFGDDQVGDVMELAKFIAGNEDKEAKITLIHEGEKKTVAVTPSKRPDTMPLPPPPATDLKELKDWMEKLQKGELGEDPLRLWSMQPGVVIPKEWKNSHFPNQSKHLQLHFVLPKNTSVTITRADDGPAKIVVKKDSQTWNVNGDQLDKLPDDVREIVKGMLGRNLPITIPGGNFRLELDKRLKQPLQPTPKLTPIPEEEAAEEQRAPPVDRNLDTIIKKLDEMNQRLREGEKETQRQMENLRQEVERLKKKKV